MSEELYAEALRLIRKHMQPGDTPGKMFMRVARELDTRTSAQSGGEPVAWIVLSDDADKLRIWWRDKDHAEDWSRKYNKPLIPLYTDPRIGNVLPLATPIAGEPGAWREALEQCLGCIEAAEAEGLHELIVELRGSNETVDRLIDLIDRRLLWVREYAQPAIASAPQPAIPPQPAAGEREEMREKIARKLASFNGNTFDANGRGIHIAEHDKEKYRAKADALLSLMPARETGR